MSIPNRPNPYRTPVGAPFVEAHEFEGYTLPSATLLGSGSWREHRARHDGRHAELDHSWARSKYEFGRTAEAPERQKM